jgi:hypothetical protein
MNKTLYTAQSDLVLEKLKENDCIYVKKEYIQKKYGEDLSKNIFIAYDWFRKAFKEKVDSPEKADYPFWLFEDPRYAKTYGGAHLIKLSIPENEIVFFDNHKWERVLNLNFVGQSKTEEKAFDQNLKKYGLQTGLDVFNSPLHISLKTKIKKSFERIFELDENSVIRAASWYLKKDWMNEIID